MLSENHNATLVIAGPGAGKTHGMVEEIEKQLPFLLPHRYMAVVTYTNAASGEIKRRLASRVKIPDNLFIGTIHSFLSKFVFSVYGPLWELVPHRKVFVEAVHLPANPMVRNIVRNSILKKGIVPYDQIIAKASKLVSEDKRILHLVANRLQSLFVDEYQDATRTQHKIFQEIMRAGKTEMYFVGDPEQYIYGYAYQGTGQKAPVFEKIPIMDLQNTRGVATRIEEINKRSDIKIVEFINHLNTQVKQKSTLNIGLPVHFLNDTHPDRILSVFDEICDRTRSLHSVHSSRFSRFYLARKNKTIDRISDLAGLTPISNEETPPYAILSSVLEFITSTVGISEHSICEQKDLTRLQFRRLGVKALRMIRNNPGLSEQDMKTFVHSELGIAPDTELSTQNRFASIMRTNQILRSSQGYYSTIHKAKGLEADAVLVIAESAKELKEWLETDKRKRFSDKLDSCRIGFVAYSRAKRLLCIACLDSIGPELLSRMDSLGVIICPPHSSATQN